MHPQDGGRQRAGDQEVLTAIVFVARFSHPADSCRRVRAGLSYFRPTVHGLRMATCVPRPSKNSAQRLNFSISVAAANNHKNSPCSLS